MSDFWFTSDLHLGHKNILRFQPNRKYADLAAMHQGIVESINRNVGPTGVLYHLGDFSFMNNRLTLEIMRDIRIGEMRFLYGNHDSEDRFDHLIHDANSQCGREQFVILGDYQKLKVASETVLLFHYPMEAWNECHHGSIHLHGHEHGTFYHPGRRFDVGFDSDAVTGKHESRPFSFTEILSEATKRPFTRHGPAQMKAPYVYSSHCTLTVSP